MGRHHVRSTVSIKSAIASVLCIGAMGVATFGSQSDDTSQTTTSLADTSAVSIVPSTTISTTTESVPVPTEPPQPPNPGDVKNCSDFANDFDAKAWFDSYHQYYGDVAFLDADGDLIPCEVPTTTTPPPPPPPAPQAPPQPQAPPPPAPEPAKPPPAPAANTGSTGSGWQAMWKVIQRHFPDAVLSSGYRCTDNGYHCKGQAIDISYSMTDYGKAKMIEVSEWIAANYPSSIELIHTPGVNLWNGQPYVYEWGTQQDHYDHVHWAYVGSV